TFFFSSRRRHTRCLSDWSSDVCSSDLGDFLARFDGYARRMAAYVGDDEFGTDAERAAELAGLAAEFAALGGGAVQDGEEGPQPQIGRASCREGGESAGGGGG